MQSDLSSVTPRTRARPDAISLERSRLRASTELSAALSRAATTAEVAHAVLAQGLVAFGADAAALALVDPRAPELVELVDTFGYPEPLIDEWRRFPLAIASPVTEAIRRAEPAWVASPDHARDLYPTWAAAVADTPDRAWAALPLIAAGHVLGALGLSYRAEHPFDEDEQLWLVSIADRCAQALERARLDEHTHALVERLRIATEASGIGTYELDVVTARRPARRRAGWGSASTSRARSSPRTAARSRSAPRPRPARASRSSCPGGPPRANPRRRDLGARRGRYRGARLARSTRCTAIRDRSGAASSSPTSRTCRVLAS